VRLDGEVAKCTGAALGAKKPSDVTVISISLPISYLVYFETFRQYVSAGAVAHRYGIRSHDTPCRSQATEAIRQAYNPGLQGICFVSCSLFLQYHAGDQVASQMPLTKPDNVVECRALKPYTMR
jgi:hypothetical protein